MAGKKKDAKLVEKKAKDWKATPPTYVDYEDIFMGCELVRRKNVNGYGYNEPIKLSDGTIEHHPWLNDPDKPNKGSKIASGAVLPYYAKWPRGQMKLLGAGDKTLRTNCVTATLNALAIALSRLRTDPDGNYMAFLEGEGRYLSHSSYAQWFQTDDKQDNTGGPGMLVMDNLGVMLDVNNVRRGDAVTVNWKSGGSHCVFCWDARRDSDGSLWIQIISSQSSTNGVNVCVSREAWIVSDRFGVVERNGARKKLPLVWQDRDKPWLETRAAREYFRNVGQWYRVPGNAEDGSPIKVGSISVARFHRRFPRYPIALGGTTFVSDSMPPPSPAPPLPGTSKTAPPAAGGKPAFEAPEARTAEQSSKLYYANNEGTREAPRKGGFFPIASSRHWHGGVHLYPSKEDDRVYAPIDGVLVAARLSTEKNKAKLGDTGFVLLKTKLEIDKKEQTFFTLLYHLAPMADGKDAVWLDSLLALPADDDARWEGKLDKSKAWRDIQPVPENPHRDRTGADAEDGGLNVFDKKKIEDTPKGTIPLGATVQVVEALNPVGWAKLKTQDGSLEGWALAEQRLRFVDAHELDSKLKEKRQKLLDGEVVDFYDLDQKILVRVGEQVGKVGEVGGERAIHFQIFSTNVIPFLDKTKADVEDSSDDTFVDKSEFEQTFFKLFDQTDEGGKGKGTSTQHFMIKGSTRKEDDILTRDEICRFYAANPQRDKMRTLITKHLSEWGDKIDWKKLDNAPEWKHASQAAKDAFHDEVAKLAWWKGDVGSSAGLPADHVCYHYHPITFLVWLDGKRAADSDGSLHASLFELNHKDTA